MSPQVQLFLFIFYFAIAITLIILAFLVLRPKHTTTIQNENKLQTAFDVGDGATIVTELVKPWSVLTATRPNIILNAVTYSDLGTTQMVAPPNTACMANKFRVTDYVQVTSLQIFADLLDFNNNAQTSRAVGIYNADTGALLVSGFVDKNDPLVAGFRTHVLIPAEYVTLQIGVNYVISSIYLPTDSYVALPNVVHPLQQMVPHSYAIVPGATSIVLPDPSAFTTIADSLLFASFQMALVPTVNQTSMTVDTATGIAELPVSYAYGLNSEVESTTQVHIDPGICVNAYNDVNMRSDGELVVSATDVGKNGLDIGTLEADTWYAVYLLNSTLQGLAPAGILSKNLQEPNPMPLSYDTFRRVGWVVTDGSANLIPTSQTGNGAQRNTFYKTAPLAFTHNFTPFEMSQNPPLFLTLPLEKVSPPGTACRLRIVTNNTNTEPLTLTLRPAVATGLTSATSAFIPLGAYAQFLVVNISPQPLPHALDINVQKINTTPANNVTLSCYVVSFVSDM